MSEPAEPAESTVQQVFPAAPLARLNAQVRPIIVGVLILSVLTGVVFPLALFAIAHTLFQQQAMGSLLTRDDRVIVGSELIGQDFSRPEYLHPRPSAAGNGYDATNSGGTNLGPYNPKLTNGSADFAGIRQLAKEYRELNGLAPNADIPIDAVTRSASGLDPDISPENAALQVARVARARGVPEDAVRRVVGKYTKPPQFGFLGNSRIAVLPLNLELDRAYPIRR
jgi:potassium-transporting ATPase KdpC subunit